MRLVLGLLLLLQSSLSFACWRLQGSLAAGDKELRVNQKVEHDRVYSFPLGDTYFHARISSTDKMKPPALELWVEQKQGRTLVELEREKILMKLNQDYTQRVEKNDLVLLWHLKLKDT